MINNKYNIDDKILFLKEEQNKNEHPFGCIYTGTINSIFLHKDKTKALFNQNTTCELLYDVGGREVITEDQILGLKSYANSGDSKEYEKKWNNVLKIRKKYEKLFKKYKEKKFLSLKEKLKAFLKKENLIIEEDNNKKE